MKDQLIIRRLDGYDAEAYREFRLRALRRCPTAFTSTFAEEERKPLAWTAERLAAQGRPHDRVLGAFTSALGLVGAAGLSVPARQQERHNATLFGMAVERQVARRGIGRALVARVIDHARAVGVLQVTLTVSEGNAPAEQLYRSCGFEVWGREPRAVIVGGRAIAKLHMACTLDRARRAP